MELEKYKLEHNEIIKYIKRLKNLSSFEEKILESKSTEEAFDFLYSLGIVPFEKFKNEVKNEIKMVFLQNWFDDESIIFKEEPLKIKFYLNKSETISRSFFEEEIINLLDNVLYYNNSFSRLCLIKIDLDYISAEFYPHSNN